MNSRIIYRFLQLLLQITIRFGLLHSHGYCPEAAIVTSWICFVDARTLLIIVCDQDHT